MAGQIMRYSKRRPVRAFNSCRIGAPLRRYKISIASPVDLVIDTTIHLPRCAQAA
jgi:hypothetical protein